MGHTNNSREVSNLIDGFIAHKLKRITKNCCEYLLISSENYLNQTYLHELSRGGLTIPSQSLCECVAQAFSNLVKVQVIFGDLKCNLGKLESKFEYKFLMIVISPMHNIMKQFWKMSLAQ